MNGSRAKEHALAEQIEVRTSIHLPFTEVYLFRSLVLDERSSDGLSLRLSMTNIAAKG